MFPIFNNSRVVTEKKWQIQEANKMRPTHIAVVLGILAGLKVVMDRVEYL